LVRIGVLINEPDQASKKNRERFSAAGWRIHKAASAINDVLPCFFLEVKCLHAFGGKPLMNDSVPFGIFKFQHE